MAGLMQTDRLTVVMLVEGDDLTMGMNRLGQARNVRYSAGHDVFRVSGPKSVK